MLFLAFDASAQLKETKSERWAREEKEQHKKDSIAQYNKTLSIYKKGTTGDWLQAAGSALTTSILLNSVGAGFLFLIAQNPLANAGMITGVSFFIGVINVALVATIASDLIRAGRVYNFKP